MSGLLIYNPKAGGNDDTLLPKLIAALDAPTVVTVDDLKENEDIAARAKEAGAEWVAVAGGDGTVESIAKSLIGTGVPLGVITMGTYNNFARSLNLPLDPIEACAVIRQGHAVPVDAGMANGEPFFESVGAGLDAALFPLGEDIKSGQFRKWIDLFRRAYRYPRQTFVLTLDRPLSEAMVRSSNESHRLSRRLARSGEKVLTLSALMVTVSNGPYYGMNFAVAPDERMDDGLLTVSVFKRYSKAQLWWHFVSIAFGRRVYSPKTIAFRVAKVEISGPRQLATHVDGSPKKLWPLKAECQARALRVFRQTGAAKPAK